MIHSHTGRDEAKLPYLKAIARMPRRTFSLPWIFGAIEHYARAVFIRDCCLDWATTTSPVVNVCEAPQIRRSEFLDKLSHSGLPVPVSTSNLGYGNPAMNYDAQMLMADPKWIDLFNHIKIIGGQSFSIGGVGPFCHVLRFMFCPNGIPNPQLDFAPTYYVVRNVMVTKWACSTSENLQSKSLPDAFKFTTLDKANKAVNMVVAYFLMSDAGTVVQRQTYYDENGLSTERVVYAKAADHVKLTVWVEPVHQSS